jgi:glycopeptide antibiotics resistance protein
VVTSFLFPKRWGILSVGLFTFGLFIEKAQEYSKRIRLPYLGRVVHGNFDPEDVQYNLLGILLGLVIFHSYQKIRKSKV